MRDTCNVYLKVIIWLMSQTSPYLHVGILYTYIQIDFIEKQNNQFSRLIAILHIISTLYLDNTHSDNI